MSKILTTFERHLKDKIADYEMPYEQSSWFDIQKSMGGVKSGKYSWVVALLSTVVVTAIGSFAFYHNQYAPASAQSSLAASRFEKIISVNPVKTAKKSGIEQAFAFVGSNAVDVNKASTSKTLPSSGHQSNNIIDSNSSNNSLATTALTADKQVSKSTTPEVNLSSSPIKTNSEVKVDDVLGFASNVRQACEGMEVNFDVTNGPKNGSYLWNFGDGHFSDAVNPKHKYAKAGKYDVSLSVTSDKGQINTTVMNDMIIINPAPNADFRWEFINEQPQSPVVQIINSSEDATTYEWTFADGSTSQLASPVVPVDSKGKKMIALSVKNGFGCTDGSVKSIAPNTDFVLSAPNTLTPGKEMFMPAGLKQSKVNFELDIYNVSGEQIYETSSRLKGWDGKLAAGGVAAIGETYTWKIVITNDITKEQKYFNGILTISP